MYPRMLESGVRSSWETIVISSDFARSLWRSCSFWTSSSRRPCSTDSAIVLNALVSSRISAGPASGMRVERSPAAIREAPLATIANRARDGAHEVAADEQEQEAGGGERDAADQHGLTGPVAGRRGVAGDEPVLVGEQRRQIAA